MAKPDSSAPETISMNNLTESAEAANAATQKPNTDEIKKRIDETKGNICKTVTKIIDKRLSISNDEYTKILTKQKAKLEKYKAALNSLRPYPLTVKHHHRAISTLLSIGILFSIFTGLTAEYGGQAMAYWSWGLVLFNSLPSFIGAGAGFSFFNFAIFNKKRYEKILGKIERDDIKKKNLERELELEAENKMNIGEENKKKKIEYKEKHRIMRKLIKKDSEEISILTEYIAKKENDNVPNKLQNLKIDIENDVTKLLNNAPKNDTDKEKDRYKAECGEFISKYGIILKSKDKRDLIDSLLSLGKDQMVLNSIKDKPYETPARESASPAERPTIENVDRKTTNAEETREDAPKPTTTSTPR